MPEIYIKVHYCIVCKKTEICQEAECDFRELMHAHGSCYGKLSKAEQVKLDQDIEKGLSADVKETERKAKRSAYMKEYRKQWKELNPKYHNVYRENNPDTMKTIRKRYTSSEKGKAVRKKYADKTKAKRSEYQKNYMKEYRARKKAEKDSNKYKISPPFGLGMSPNLGSLASPKKFNVPSFNNPQQVALAKRRAREVQQAELVRRHAEANKQARENKQSEIKSRLSELTRAEKSKLLTTRIREIETLLELGTEGTQGVVSLQKQLMKCKTALRRLNR
jgi:hypothetical protein